MEDTDHPAALDRIFDSMRGVSRYGLPIGMVLCDIVDDG